MNTISLELHQSLFKLLKKIRKKSQKSYSISDVEVLIWLEKLLYEQLNINEYRN